MLSVTSHFQSKIDATNPSSIVEVFTFQNSDMSNRVLNYGVISRNADQVIGGDYVVELENASQTFNSLLINKLQFFQQGKYEYGFSTESGTNDTIQMFGGKLVKADFRETKVTLTFEDLLARLKERTVGTKKNPVTFANANPADLAWSVVTSYGALSTVKSSSNTDIEYQHWLNWWTIFDDETILVNANLEGQTVIEILSTLQKLTDSTIYAEGSNKLHFHRWSGIVSGTITITDSIVTGISNLGITGTTMVNKFRVMTNYNTTSNQWAGEIEAESPDSVNSYGLFEAVYDDTSIWFVDSTSALNLAQRLVFRRATPNIKVNIHVPLTHINAEIGDEILLTTQIYSLDGKVLNLNGYDINTEAGIMTMRADEGFGKGSGRLQGFILDNSSYGLLDQTYNPIF